ncbi:MAG: energy transducer TonB [Nitrosomonadaceae bacterium]
MLAKLNPVFLPGLLFVLAIHGALFYVLWNQRLIPPPEQIAKIFVNFITQSKVEEVSRLDLPLLPSKPKLKPKPKPKPKLVEKQQLQQLVPEAPVLSETEVIAPSPPPVAVVQAPVPESALVSSVPTGPINLSTELSVTCPELTPPSYPPLSRRLGEEGKLVLRVELDEGGYVSTARVVESSSYQRLDEAALAIVKTWRCNPSLRNGQPVRAVALQPFNFVLQGY